MHEKEPPIALRRGGGAAFVAVLGCFGLSGFAALLYETAWLRQFSIVFGTSELAVATVLASYMCGLAIGAALAGRLVGRVRRPVLVYGLLELGIALSALAVPAALRLARVLQATVLGGRAEPPDAGGAVNAAFYFACAVVILAVPTAFMGATLPLLTRHAVRRADQIGSRVGVLYATNTAGAVMGTVTAAFLLLPALGLRGTLLAGAAVNAVVFVIAALIGRGAVVETAGHGRPAEEAEAAGIGRRWPASRAAWVLPLMLFSGAASFTYEVLWTRLLGQLLGGSIFAFAIMLASFLTGITVGSAVASRFATGRDRSVRGLVAVQFGTAVLSIAIYYGLDRLPDLAAALHAGALASPARNLAVAAVVLLPATLCIGATFPFAVRVLARTDVEAGPVSARVYAWNTAGAILGAVLAGFVLIPALRFEGAVLVAVALNLLLAVAATQLGSGRSRRFSLAVLGAAAVVMAMFRPGMPEHLIRSSPLPGHDARGRIVYYGVGRSATVLMSEDDGWLDLLSNGHPESGVRTRGTLRGLESARWLAALPAFARPQARSMLIVGFGGGTTVCGVPPWIEDVDVIEIEPEIIEANRAISGLRDEDPLGDPRLHLRLNDARGALAVTTRRYDIIVSQPSHPWTAGASHLYTREFLTEARGHLRPGGVFVQWMNAAFVDEALLKMLGATVLDVFAHVRVYTPEATMLTLLASDEPLEPEAVFAGGPAALATSPDYLPGLGVRTVEDVLARLALNERGLRELCRGAAPNTDDRNRFATRGPRVLPQALWAAGVQRLTAPYEPLVDPDGRVLDLDVDWIYLVGRLLTLGRADRAAQVAAALPAGREHLVATALIERAAGRGDEAKGHLREALALDPGDRAARFALIEASMTALARGEADPETTADAAALTGPEAAVVEGAAREVRGDWEGLRALDDRLAQAAPTDLCFNHALRLRAAWRGGPEPSADAAPRAAEAMALIDQLLVLDANWRSYVIRARAATAADRPAVLLETAGAMARRLRRLATNAPPARRRAVGTRARQVLRALRPISLDNRVSSPRRAEVRRALQDLIRLAAGEHPSGR